jgi:hypothetical protein
VSRRSPDNEALEFAWRVHSALDSWTAKVDTKASIVLALEAAVLGFIITLSSKDGPLAALDGGDVLLYRVGLTLVGLGVLFALGVVVPQLGRRKAKRVWERNTIYFGHLRHWDPEKLAGVLVRDMPRERQLAEQLVEMSKIAWRKHAWLQWSLIAFVGGGLCLAIASL